ncbi:MAG: MBL fold metallo-hydrolase [Patescibacteria group bacterium]
MKISFYGACREVTGSCILVVTTKNKFLVDCGIFQGEKFAMAKNFEPFEFDASSIDFVLLTHAHLDHCGRLPKLVKAGFKGKIYCSEPTKDLTEIILEDSARVIQEEARRHQHQPLYLAKDVLRVKPFLSPLAYGQKIKINSNTSIRILDAGHILGSAIFEVWLKEKDGEKKLVFSGDLGNPPAPIVRDTEFVSGADLVVVESTYGGRTHESPELRRQLLQQAVKDSVGRGGALLIPAFALERTQEVLYELNFLVENKMVPAVPIFVDSPLAIKVTSIYKKYASFYDQESRKLIEAGDDLFNFPGLVYTPTVEESKKINITPAPKVILAGNGMANGGRIPYHLKLNLDNPNNQLLIIAYQVAGSLGRQLLDGAEKVIIDGAEVRVRAKVTAIGSYSSHADGPTLLHWLEKIKQPKPRQIFVVHGEKESNFMLADKIKEKLGISATVPEPGRIYEI